MRYLRIILVGLLAALVTGVLVVSASDGTTHYDPLTAEALSAARSASLLPAIYASPEDSGPGAEGLASKLPAAKDPRMSSHVARLAQAEHEARARGETIDALSLSRLDPDLQAMAELRLVRIDGQGRVQAYLLVATTVDEVVADVKRAQGQVERLDKSAGIVQALVPIGQLEALAHRPSVKFVRLPDYGFPQAGSEMTEGDSILGADAVRSSFGVDGTGVKVGVISDGVGGIAASQASGDLPAVNTTTCNVVGADPTLSGAEGTAMLEIVHDLAPGAELWFGHFAAEGTTLAFNAAVDCLATNTDIVVDDIGGFNVGLYDGTSSISANTSTELNRISNPIRAYATAVGNAALSHYQEPFADSGFDVDLGGGPLWDIHRFQETGNTSDANLALPCDANFPNILCGDSLFLVAGGSVVVFLQWSDPFGASSNDYDLFLLDEIDGLVAASANFQTGSQDPVEAVGWINDSGQDRWFDVVIGRFAGSVRTFDMFVICSGCALFPNDAIHNFNTPGSSVPNQGDAGGGVISAGAINADDPANNEIAFYSSRGPTNDSRIKPDITGIDGVSITGAGGFPTPFFGTSAAAPHIAGIAALLLECNADLQAGEPGDSPSGDRTALRGALLDNAVDLGAPGVDNTYGYGRVDAPASAEAICVDADGDGDGVPDASDNCPAWPNAGQSLPPWTVPENDPDCDGFTTTLENHVGTVPNLACGSNAWPPDIDESGTVSGGDVFTIFDFWLTSVPRYDIDESGTVSGGDVFLIFDWWLASCT